MADSPVRLLVKIGDPTTAANEAAVSASGELSVILAANDGVDIGDVTVADFGAALTDTDDDIVAGAQETLRVIGLTYGWDGTQWERVTTDASGSMDVNITADAVGLMLGTDFSSVMGSASLILATQADDVVNTSDGLQTSTFNYVFDGATWDRMLGDSANGTLVNLGTNNDITIEGGAVVGTDGGAGPADVLSIGGTESGGNIQEILVDSTGALQVDVLSGGGESTPTGHVAVRATSADVAVDATINVDEADAGGTTSKCRGFDASASVPIKAELQSVVDGTGTPIVTLFAQAGEPIHWRAPHRDYFETAFGANAGFDGWRVVVTNKDSTDPADLYGTIYTEN